MPAKTRSLIAGLTPAELDELRAELLATPASSVAPRELTARERVLGSLMRDRDHLDGCPVIGSPERAGERVEAYEERATAPSQGLRSIGVDKDGPVVVVRCTTCAGARYFAGSAPAGSPIGVGHHIAALILAHIDSDEPAAGELDGSI